MDWYTLVREMAVVFGKPKFHCLEHEIAMVVWNGTLFLI